MMTIYQQSFYPPPLSFMAHVPSRSLESLCSSTKSSCYQNTTTDCEESLSLLSLPSDEDEEQDWKEFGYLLDQNPTTTSLPSFKGQTFSRSNSMPNSPEIQSSEASNCSSMDVQLCSSRGSSSARTQSCSSEGEHSQEEPIAKRTRRSLAKRETLSQGLDRLSDIPKEDMILNFLSTQQQQQQQQEKPKAEPTAVKWHNVCRPWWHNKIFHQEKNGSNDPFEFKSEEEENTPQALRKPIKEFSDEMCDPRHISLGGNTISGQDKEIKMDSSCSEPLRVLSTRNSSGDVKTEATNESDGPTPTKPFEGGRKTKRMLSHTEKTEIEEPMSRGSPKKRTKMGSSVKKANNKSPSRKSIGSKRQQKVIQYEAEDENTEKHCLCGALCDSSDQKRLLIICSNCKSHFHAKCVGITEKKARKLSSRWTCPECEAEKKSEELYCVCRQPYDETKFYVGCDSCEGWFHPQCIGTTQEEISKFDEFLCPQCRQSNND